MVNASADSLLYVINDILDFSKIEAGKLGLDRIPFCLTDNLVEALRSTAVRAHEKGLGLVYEVDAGVPDGLLGDPGRLRQILLNVIGNAIKFTEEGEVAVRVALEEGDAESVLLHFFIRDTGIGIPEEKQESVFTAFAQADGSTTRRFGGTGLGLSISKQLVSLMGGGIWLESQVGQGTTFHFTANFGLHESASEELPIENTDLRLRDLNVLIVDDNATNRRLLEGLLTRWQINNRSASSGREALQILEERHFELVLLDFQMPRMNGLEVAAEIRRRWPETEIKIVVLTSMGVRGDAAMCRELKVDAYLTKPFKSKDLFLAIRRLLLTEPSAIAHGSRNLITHHSLREEKTPAPPLRPLRILVAEDNRVNQALARRLLEKQGHTVTTAVNGREAIQESEKTVYDLILMDVQMPEVDGLQATQEIRRREASGRRTPIIALTAHAMSSDEERCLAAGMDGFISKPIVLSELAAAMSALCAESAL
jgi:two-component system sensor histidine kinase/response regulator